MSTILRTPKHAYLYDDIGPLPGVTTAIDMYGDKDALVTWGKREVAKFAVGHAETIIAHRGHGEFFYPETCGPCRVAMDAAGRSTGTVSLSPDEASQRWAQSLPDRKRDAAANLGTRVHAVAERINKGEPAAADEDARPFAIQYQRWLGATQPDLIAIEYVGVNLTYGYGGTGDIIVRPRFGSHGGLVVAVDIKTHTDPDKPLPRSYYPKTGMQLAACSRFEFIGRDPVELPGESLRSEDVVPNTYPQPDAYGVLLLGREDYRFIPYRVTERTFLAFLACLDTYRWRYGEAKSIVGAA